MCPVLSLHYCHCNVLCTFLLCCTTASTVCYVCFVCVALLPAQGAMYFLFVFAPLASAGCYVRLALCCTTASAVCHVCLVCSALLPVQCAAVEHCQHSVPLLNTASAVWQLLNTASAVCRCSTLQAQCATVEHCQRSVPLLNTASAVRCY